MFDHYTSSLAKGVKSVYSDDPDNVLSYRLQANVTRFAAFKTAHVTRLLKGILNDDTTPVKERDSKAKQILKTFDRYQKSEAEMAVIRSRTAKQFSEFMQPDSLRLFPSLRWVPSRSVQQREEHIPYYNRVWRKDDPFWALNTPGTLWGCKCDVEETNDAVTDNYEVKEVKPQQGLEGNPAITGEVFTDNISYTRKAGNIKLDEDTHEKYPNLQTLINADGKSWRSDYYTNDGGVLITSRKRIAEADLNKQELEKFNKEYGMCRALAMNGHRVVYRETVEGSFDILLDDKPADLKKTASDGNIVKYANKAVNRQGAELVVFEFVNETAKIHARIEKLKQLNLKGYYFFSRDKTKLYPF